MFTESQKNRAEFDALRERISSYSAGILTDGGRGVGTGTLVRRGAERLILTADHVLRGTNLSELRFVFRPQGTLQEAPLRGLARKRPLLSSGRLLRGELVRDTGNDLAAVVISGSQEIGGPSDWYDATDAQTVQIRDGASVLYVGFPVDNSVDIGPNIKAVGAVADHLKYDSALISADTLDSSFNPETHFLIKYAMGKEGLEPHGLSGAGMWCPRVAASGVWAPTPLLVGVITAYRRKPELLEVANLGCVLQLLSRL